MKNSFEIICSIDYIFTYFCQLIETFRTSKRASTRHFSLDKQFFYHLIIISTKLNVIRLYGIKNIPTEGYIMRCERREVNFCLFSNLLEYDCINKIEFVDAIIDIGLP